jgi:hypothetical protein
MPGGWDVDPQSVDRRMALAREWDALVDRVRELPEFADFLRPPRLETLLPAAADGPVVIVNVSMWRCDAIIVRHTGITPCALPGLTFDDASAWAQRYLNTLRAQEAAADAYDAARAQRQERPDMARRQAMQRAGRTLAEAAAATETLLTDLLGWLWDTIAEPVLAELELLDTPGDGEEWHRVWWCPTGPLTLLPLHAAGHHHDPREHPARTVMDRVVSSYTPTLRALLEARRPLDPPIADTGRLLVVGLTETPGQQPLRGVASELGVLHELVPDRTVLEGPAATREAVLRALDSHRWVHFSCHGNQDLDDPSRGGLALHDGMLTIAHIGVRQYHAEFAGLSACKTATGGAELLDEAITLAAALHYTGYRHVIGTLWSVHDSPGTADLFATIYRDMAVNGRVRPERSATALHWATRALRDRYPDRPSAWTPFIHTGP